MSERPPGASPHWSRRAERGSALGLRIVLAAFRLLGIRGARALLLPVVAYFFLTGRRARHASQRYLARVHAFTRAQGPAPGLAASWRHLRAFGDSALDKLAAWSGRITEEDVRFDDRARFEALLAAGQGALFISAHLGNLEMTRALASRFPAARINAVVYTEHARRFNEALASVDPAFVRDLVQVKTLGPDTAMALEQKVARGEIVVIVGDRTPPAEGGAGARVSRVPFLGEDAAFAHGPFVLASLLRCPVYLFFCLREADGYRIHLEPFAERVVLRRGHRQEDLDAIAARFAARLEHYCLRAPLQWFNFFDFWQR